MLTIDFSEVLKIKAFLDRFERKTQDWTSFFKEHAAQLIIDEIVNIFRTEGYGRWDRLSPEYARRKAVTHPGQTILRRDDAYFNAATSLTHPGNLAVFNKLEMVLGVRGDFFQGRAGYPYPSAHEEGRGVPKRAVYELLVQNPDFRKRLVTAMQNALTAAARTQQRRG